MYVFLLRKLQIPNLTWIPSLVPSQSLQILLTEHNWDFKCYRTNQMRPKIYHLLHYSALTNLKYYFFSSFLQKIGSSSQYAMRISIFSSKTNVVFVANSRCSSSKAKAIFYLAVLQISSKISNIYGDELASRCHRNNLVTRYCGEKVCCPPFRQEVIY